MDEISRKAFAKVNLSLDVIRKRPDGYHDLCMVMQTVGVFDVVTCKKRSDGEVCLKTDSGILSAEDASDNLCVRAAKLLASERGAGGVDIFLEKHIPIAAGLAGGSTDAAAVLKCVNSLYGLNISQGELEELGLRLGADVPYTLRGGTVLCEGIGDVMMSLPAAPECAVLLATPDIQVSTAFVYGTLVLDESAVHPDAAGQAEAIRAGDLRAMAAKCDNLLARVTERNHPVIPRLRDTMMRAGALNSIMSGSGPTVFGLFPKRSEAERCAHEIQASGMANAVFVTEFIDNIDNIDM